MQNDANRFQNGAKRYEPYETMPKGTKWYGTMQKDTNDEKRHETMQNDDKRSQPIPAKTRKPTNFNNLKPQPNESTNPSNFHHR